MEKFSFTELIKIANIAKSGQPFESSTPDEANIYLLMKGLIEFGKDAIETTPPLPF